MTLQPTIIQCGGKARDFIEAMRLSDVIAAQNIINIQERRCKISSITIKPIRFNPGVNH